MAERAEVAIAAASIPISRAARETIAVIGNPNSGKSTVFNRLTGMRQKTANYPGVTVERRVGRMQQAGSALDLIDLPGTYSLSPDSMDERIAVSVLLGRMEGTPRPDALLAVIDATRLYQGLFLVQQLVEIGRPVAVALTMTDAAELRGLDIDIERLGAILGGARVYPVVATTGRGFEELRKGLAELSQSEPPSRISAWPELERAVDIIEPQLGSGGFQLSRPEIERLLIDGPEGVAALGAPAVQGEVLSRVHSLQLGLFGDEPPLAVEARKRYQWAVSTLRQVQTSGSVLKRQSAVLIDWINRPWPSTILFVLTMALVFQAIFAWATVPMDLIDAGVSGIGSFIGSFLPEGAIQSFIVDGVIAGVGSVIIFLPQILILFLFIILMEDTGYLARAAFLVDRAMRGIGLSGQSVIPLLSSFACAVPSIMATRVIPNRRDRIATIMASPFMTCSARWPVYTLMIGAFIPEMNVGPLNLQGLVLFGLFLVGIFGGVMTALILRRFALRGENPAFILALPDFRRPDLRSVIFKLLDRARVFLRRAGTIIFVVAIIVWALVYFPQSSEIENAAEAQRVEAVATLEGDALEARLADISNVAAADQISQSFLGRAGQLIEPVFAPLGWDWRVSAAVIAGFPAREVVVAVLGTIYAVGDEASEESLAERLTAATWPDGTQVFTLPMVLGLLLFYAWCLQCAATIAVIRRETNSLRWPLFAWTYMTALGYFGALLIYQIGTAA